MYAVFRETNYPPAKPIYETSEFREFQSEHARRRGYRGTVVAEIGPGRFLSVTLWEMADDMAAARVALGPIVERLLDPLMSSPSVLLGTGPVVVNDLAEVHRKS
jgi:hypothetical protein